MEILRRTGFGTPVYVLGHPTDVVLRHGSPYLQPYVLYRSAELDAEMEAKNVKTYRNKREAVSARKAMGMAQWVIPPTPDVGVMVQLDERTQHGTLRVLSSETG